MLKFNLYKSNGLRKVQTSGTQSSQGIDEIINNRNDVSNNNVQIEDSLIDEYNLDLFNDENTNLNSVYETEKLFLEESNLGENHVSSAYQSLFTEETSYHQQIDADITANYLLLLWIAIMLMLSIVVSKIIKIKRKNAN
ncbi:hypothetical protein RZE82_06405 [Mollicutes bacterium LVI A0039]|nr:hypothetical protein RZE82_06405 [Mollicutes bacterium LVI A0039]